MFYFFAVFFVNIIFFVFVFFRFDVCCKWIIFFFINCCNENKIYVLVKKIKNYIFYFWCIRYIEIKILYY